MSNFARITKRRIINTESIALIGYDDRKLSIIFISSGESITFYLEDVVPEFLAWVTKYGIKNEAFT